MSNERSRPETVAILAKAIAGDPNLKTLVKEYINKTRSQVDAAQTINAKSVMSITDQQFVRLSAFSAGQSALLDTIYNEVFHPATDAALSTRTGSDLL